jgi:hypothetical protein
MKTIIRVKRQTGNFTIISNEVLRDKMSLRAKGLLCMILSCVDEWVVTKSWVSQHCTDGREALRASFYELVKLGYATVEEQGKGEDGRFAQQVWTFFDQANHVREVAQNEPFSAESRQRNPDVGNPSPKNTIEEDQLRNTCGGAAKASSRNPLCDTLAQVCGMDIECMTADEWKKVGIAIAAIRKAQPNVTTKDVQSHAVNYRTLFKDAVLTPLALRNHWGATASKSSLRGLSSQSGVHTPNDLQNLKERISAHVANPRWGTMFAGTIFPKQQEEYDQMVARYAEMSQTEGGK